MHRHNVTKHASFPTTFTNLSVCTLLLSTAIYLTGLSMGGFGTFHYLEEYASENLIAAAMSVCGGGNVKGAAKLKDIPIWAFHGEKDQVVPAVYSMEMINAINKNHPIEKSKVNHLSRSGP